MNFKYLIKSCELENIQNDEKSDKNMKMIITKLFDIIEAEMDKNPDITFQDIDEKINTIVQDYLDKLSSNSLKIKLIDYYMNLKRNSKEYNIADICNKLKKEHDKKNIDLDNDDLSNTAFSYNIKKDFEYVVRLYLQVVRKEKSEILKIDGMNLLMDVLCKQTSKEREMLFKTLMNEHNVSKEEIAFYKASFEMFKSPESKLVENCIDAYMKSRRGSVSKDGEVIDNRNFKETCIDNITSSIEFLDKFGLLDVYINNSNYMYKNKMHVTGIEYTKENLKEQLSEENLKSKNIETLMILSSFWINRVNKTIADINKGLYIIGHKELLEERDLEDGTVCYYVSKENRQNVDLKMRVIHKICFEMFEEIDFNSLEFQDENETDNTDCKKKLKSRKADISSQMQKKCKQYGKEYKKYFDKLFPDIDNSLEEDIMNSNIMENTRFNSYKIKDENMQMLLTCLFNSDFNKIENFGYIEEDNKKKREILIGVDIKGLNMPLLLHMNKQLVIDYLKETQGNTLMPVYKGFEDFQVDNDKIRAQILAPLTPEIEAAIIKNSKDAEKYKRFAKAIKHMCYYTKNGKMPEHLLNEVGKCKGKKKYKYVREYVDLENIGALNKEDIEK